MGPSMGAKRKQVRDKRGSTHVPRASTPIAKRRRGVAEQMQVAQSPTAAAAQESGRGGGTRALSALQRQLRERLAGGDFRRLNERLYTQDSRQSARLLQARPELFAAYHAGFDAQTRRWPHNPLDSVIRSVSRMPRRTRVADLGCGGARLAQSVVQRVSSFDLVAMRDGVVECDMAALPVDDDAFDVAVFCLSLMGTNYGEFVAEARRVVVGGGLLLVAEVASRFEAHDASQFVRGVCRVGFVEVPDHDFVTAPIAGGVTGATTATAAKGKARRRGGAKHGKAKKGDRGRGDGARGAGSTRGDGDGDGDGDAGAAFFLRFAFRSTKGSGGATRGTKEAAAARAMVPLTPCVYKKR